MSLALEGAHTYNPLTWKIAVRLRSPVAGRKEFSQAQKMAWPG
jgi:hypothetical protein